MYKIRLCGSHIYNCRLSGKEFLKISRQSVPGVHGGVILLPPLNDTPREIELSSNLRRAGQRRSFQRSCLAIVYSVPAFAALRQSLPAEKSLPRSPPVTVYTIAANPFSRYKNIYVLVPCHCEIINLYGRRLGVEVVMLFAVERLSERSEDWPTNNSSWKLS